MRLINADALIADIQKKLAIKDIEYLTEQEKTITKMIINAPTVVEWIPVNEKLPKEWEHVLVTTDTPYTFNKIRIDWNVDNYWVNYAHHVIAWMPLPESYKGGDK